MFHLYLYLGIAMAASAILASGLVMMKSRGEDLPAARGAGAFNAVLCWIRDPMWIGGLGVEMLGYALFVLALSDAPVSLVAVTMQGGIAIFVVLAIVFLHERASGVEWLGIGGIVGAMILLAASLGNHAIEGSLDVLALYSISAGAALAAVLISSSSVCRMNGAAAAIASGIAFGLGTLYVKAISDTIPGGFGVQTVSYILTSPWPYLTVAANIIGLILLQNSFHYERGIITLPLSSACSNIVPIIGGIIAFGEHLPLDHAAAALRITSFVLTTAAGAVLATRQASAERVQQ
jgi:drug/metabolite transporter (DMT)-like permease